MSLLCTHIEILDHCKNFLRGPWLDAQIEDVNITPLKGGISNYLLVAELSNTSKYKTNAITKVLVRIYGSLRRSNPQLILDDTVIFAYLSEKKILPKLYGIFTEGRLEEYLESSRLLTPEEMRQPMFSNEIAGQLFHIHQLDLPINKSPDSYFRIGLNMLKDIMNTLNLYEAGDEITISELEKAPQNRAIESLHFVRDNSVQEEAMKLYKFMFEDMRNELSIVFCHNDLHAANVLCVSDCNQSTNLPGNVRLQIIDYEFSCYNIRGFDFAFYFNEFAFDRPEEKWPSFSYDENKLPTEEHKMNFLKAYFSQSSTPDILNDPHELYKINREIKMGFALSQIFSSIWLLKQCLYSQVNYGFLEQGKLRFQLYLKDMKELISLYGSLD